eukprot:TRINITY_DN6041_c0_g1_i1.p1 TRINITY_DN6041_c0_g1~~TRINITY_DN6041_c0_g1_i1.p1  ORF type:complete len:239 (+),score=34.26 TRINITY_DN6041_c0_g1_i1:232-948(+)
MSASFNTHFKLYGLLAGEFKRLKLQTVTDLQQSMATGIVEKENRKGYGDIKRAEILKGLGDVMADPEIPKDVKLRLVMIFIITQGGVTDDERRDLLSIFDEESSNEAVRNLSNLGVSLSASSMPDRRYRKETQRRAVELLEEANQKELLQSRFEPEMAHILRTHLSSPAALDRTFPYMGAGPEPASKSGGTSMRKPRGRMKLDFHKKKKNLLGAVPRAWCCSCSAEWRWSRKSGAAAG